jgi:hypothetical protein
VLNRLLLISIVLVFFVPADVKAVSFEDEGTTIVTTPGSIVSLDVVNELSIISLRSLDAIVCITDGALIVDARYEHQGVILPPCPVVEGPGCLEFGEFWSGNLPDGAVAQVKIKYEIGNVIVSLSAGYGFGGTWYTNDTLAAFSTGVVTIVPEPATFLLLALGAALLRKIR